MPRHGENIWKRKDGRWEARYIKERLPSGKAVYASVYARSYKDVKKKRDNVSSLLQQNKNCEMPKADLKHIVDEFLVVKKSEVKQSTLVRYAEMAEWYIYPRIGHIESTDLNQSVIDGFSSGLLECGKKDGTPLSAKTVRDVLALLKQIIKYAKKKNYIQRSDLEIKPPKLEKRIIQVLTKKEQEQLEEVVLDPEDPMKYGVFLCLYTGLRIGELCALRWEDFDLDSGILSINHTVLRLRSNVMDEGKKTKLIIEKPKTASSIRQIPLPTTINQQLLHLKDISSASGVSFFLTGSSRIIEPRNYYEKYKKYLQTGNVGSHTFHALRHTFATRCIESGVDPKALSEILGHASVQITLDRYVHPSMDAKRRSIEKMMQS